MKKRLFFGVLSLLAASFLLSQSLVDASKKEQERREKLKGKDVKVVTNADLKARPKTPAVTVGTPEAAAAQGQVQGQAAAEPGGEPQAPPEQAQGGGPAPARFAKAFDPNFFLVKNPELALGPPDDKYAEISETGVFDLELEVVNGPGDDLAIYARPPIQEVPQEERENQPAGIEGQDSMWWGAFRYAVLGLDDRGEWQEIGLGSGKNPDTFDLGALKSTDMIRIMFKVYSNPYNSGAQPLSLASGHLSFGVDAVGALH